MKPSWLIVAVVLVGSTFLLVYFALDTPETLGSATGELILIRTIVKSNNSGGKKERTYAEVQLEDDQVARIWLPIDLRPEPGEILPLKAIKSGLSNDVRYLLDVDTYSKDIK